MKKASDLVKPKILAVDDYPTNRRIVVRENGIYVEILGMAPEEFLVY